MQNPKLSQTTKQLLKKIRLLPAKNRLEVLHHLLEKKQQELKKES